MPRRKAAPRPPPLKFGLPGVRGAVVKDIEGGTLEMTIGLANGVDFEVLTEGNKVIVNMSKGPLGR